MSSGMIDFAISFRGVVSRMTFHASATFGDIATEILRLESLDMASYSITLSQQSRNVGLALDHHQTIATSDLVSNNEGVFELVAIANNTVGEVSISSMVSKLSALYAEVAELKKVVLFSTELIAKTRLALSKKPLVQYRLMYPGSRVIVLPSIGNTLEVLNSVEKAIDARIGQNSRVISPGDKLLHESKVLHRFLDVRRDEQALKSGGGDKTTTDYEPPSYAALNKDATMASTILGEDMGGVMNLEDAAWVSQLSLPSTSLSKDPKKPWYVVSSTGEPFIKSLRVRRQPSKQQRGEEFLALKSTTSVMAEEQAEKRLYSVAAVDDNLLYETVDFWCVKISLLGVDSAQVSSPSSSGEPGSRPRMTKPPTNHVRQFIAIGGHVSPEGFASKITTWLEPVAVPSVDMVMHHVHGMTLPLTGLW